MSAEEAHAKFLIVNKLGLHARAATKLVQLASRFSCDVIVQREGQQANAKSVMGVLLLCAAQGTTLEVHAKGLGASDCVKQIGDLIGDRFGESE